MELADLSFTLYIKRHCLGLQNSVMVGDIHFQVEIEISRELEDDPEAHQAARDQGAAHIVESMIEWIKDNDPYTLESYINMEVMDRLIKRGPGCLWA